MTKFALLALSLLLAGCSTMQTFPGYGKWDDTVKPLGPVTYCKGAFCHGTEEGSQWALALQIAPNAATYHSALRQKASVLYEVPQEEIVLSEVQVTLSTEVVGTVRGWKAEAKAGRRPVTAAAVAPAVKDAATRLRELQQLRDEDLITGEEFERRRTEIVNDL